LFKIQNIITTEVQIIVNDSAGNIGAKRNQCLEKAQGLYFNFIDDDDMISQFYFSKLLAAINTNPDCVGFKQTRYKQDKYLGTAIYSLSNWDWNNYRMQNENIFTRLPCHLTPIKTDIARKIKYQNTNSGEDVDYAKRIKEYLKTEYFIDEILYTYYK
jgi:glycosyltransferase involved in cell wall biosynthesis